MKLLLAFIWYAAMFVLFIWGAVIEIENHQYIQAIASGIISCYPFYKIEKLFN